MSFLGFEIPFGIPYCPSLLLLLRPLQPVTVFQSGFVSQEFKKDFITQFGLDDSPDCPKVIHLGQENYRNDITSQFIISRGLWHRPQFTWLRWHLPGVLIMTLLSFSLFTNIFREIFWDYANPAFPPVSPQTVTPDFSIYQFCLIKFAIVKISLHSGVLDLWGPTGGLG